MDIKDICSAGGDILDAVADAVNRNDYTGLSANVSNTVNRVVTQVREEAGKGTYGEPTHQYGQTAYTRKGQAGYRSIHKKEESRYAFLYKKNQKKNGEADDPNQGHPAGRSDAFTGSGAGWSRDGGTGRTAAPSASRSAGIQLPAAITKHPAGKVIGPIQLAWGILATSGFGITALVMTILLFAEGGTVFLVLAAVFGVLTAFSVTDIVRGRRKITLVNRFYRYARLIGSKGYIAVEELAFQTGQNRDDVLRDLRKMMKKHMFLQGRLDNAETTFMLTQEAYQQYLQAEQSRRNMEMQARAAAMSAAQGRAGAQFENTGGQQGAASGERTAGGMGQASGSAGTHGTHPAGTHAYDAQTRKILSDGNAYIRMVHECNEKIRNEVMSGKLSKLEAIMRRIFEQVERVPESADDLHKFMDYYLPTTTKLLQAYIDLDRQEIAGENISATKKEIEDTLDTINAAFERLLDGLFEDMAWDVSSDISVMKTMMAQEGLTGGRDFQL